ncbi:hypothetical protein FRX31_005146 [Thalictrum thalictroides]|uniref:Uncharacterized protein n=1 Tax=Thalictrum thalictroides TaxID=46969 RepID=A0A7J6X6H1_THATH|nr:hypothetical protein FRX31_005146 [Thalictrum thalictroides]
MVVSFFNDDKDTTPLKENNKSIDLQDNILLEQRNPNIDAIVIFKTKKETEKAHPISSCSVTGETLLPATLSVSVKTRIGAREG